MPFTNLSFETAGATAGSADAWTLSATTAAERVAVWGAGDPPLDEDGFEVEWGNDAYVYAFGLADTAPPILDTDVSDGEAVEDFEEGWSDNQAYLTELGSVELVLFDSGAEAVEDFAEGWSSNEAYDFTLGATTAASFDAALSAEVVEDFEDGWRGTGAGNDYLTELTASTAATFDGSSPEAVEDFEEVRAEVVLTADPVSDFLLASGHQLIAGDICSFRTVGPGALPGGLSVGFPYYVTGGSASDFQVSATSGGSTVDLTDAGSGTFVVTHDRARYWVIPHEL